MIQQIGRLEVGLVPGRKDDFSVFQALAEYFFALGVIGVIIHVAQGAQSPEGFGIFEQAEAIVGNNDSHRCGF